MKGVILDIEILTIWKINDSRLIDIKFQFQSILILDWSMIEIKVYMTLDLTGKTSSTEKVNILRELVLQLQSLKVDGQINEILLF